MQRLLSVRITHPGVKFVYVLVFVVLGPVLYQYVPVVGSLLVDVLQLGAIWYGSRVFRGAGEPVRPDRPWWRMTAWRTASGWLGVWAVAGLFLSTGTHILGLVGVKGYVPNPVYEVISLSLFWAIVAFLYLNSWARLRGTPKPPRLPASRNVIVKPNARLE